MSSHNASQAPEDASFVLPQAKPSELNIPKPYHATTVWGKRRMTLQELTRAFDAFNEDEERVALRFAGSEDWNRKLAEPLSEVKTVFLDLDGLKPPSGCHSFPPASQRHNVSHIPQFNPGTNARGKGKNEPGYIIQTGGVNNDSSASWTHEHPGIEVQHPVDDHTIKPSQKRRRSLLISASLGIPTQYTLQSEDERPPSRLGFIEDGNIDEYETDDGRDTL